MRELKRGTWHVGIALAVSLVLSVLYGILVYRNLGFVYAIADDVIMRDIASGAFTGTPDGHLIFVKYTLGFVLSRLYLLGNGVDWYGFFMAGSLFLGLWALLYRGLAAERSLRFRLIHTGIVLGLFATAMVFHAAQFEWTVSAAMLGASGLYLYATATEKAGRGQRALEGALVWLLLVLTFCIRSDVFFMVLPGLGIAFLWKFVQGGKKTIRIHFKELFLPGAVFLAVGLVVLIENRAYAGAEWEEFQDFQTARSEVYDYYGVPSYEANPDFFEERGFTEHEVRSLRHYALYLVEGMDARLMQDLSAEAKRQSASEAGLSEWVKSGAALALEQFADPEQLAVSLPALLCLLAACLLAFRDKKGAFVPLLLFLGAEVLLWLGLGFLGRLPERVAFSMHLAGLLGLGAFVYRLWPDREMGKGAAAVLFTLCLCAAAVTQWRYSIQANQEKLAMDESYQLFKQACKEEPERLYLIETYMAEPVGGAVVTAHGDYRLNNCITLGDWYTTSPLDEERFAALGIETVEAAVLNSPETYLVVRDAEDPGFLGTYFAYKYPGSEMVCREVKHIEGRDYYLYQVVMP